MRKRVLWNAVWRRQYSGRNVHGAVLGICDDRGSSYVRGAALAPQSLRAALRDDSSNLCSERGWSVEGLRDWGDLIEPSDDDLKHRVAEMLQDPNAFAVFLGGDHSITRPAVQAVQAMRRPTERKLAIIQFDAHADLYNSLATPFRTPADPSLSHAAQMTRIMEQGLCDALVQVGIRCNTREQRENIRKHKVDCLEMFSLDSTGAGIAQQIHDALRDRFGDDNFAQYTDLYVTFDMDVIEPGLAPGVAHQEPGGMTVRQCVDTLHALRCGTLVAFDIVELNPPRDCHGMLTARVAAKIFKELYHVAVLHHL